MVAASAQPAAVGLLYTTRSGQIYEEHRGYGPPACASSESTPYVGDTDRFDDIGQCSITGIAVGSRRDPDIGHRNKSQKLADPIAVAGNQAQKAVQRSRGQLWNLCHHRELLSVLQIHHMDVWCPHPFAGIGLRPPAEIDREIAVGKIGVSGALQRDSDLPRARLPMGERINRGFYLRQKRVWAVDARRPIGASEERGNAVPNPGCPANPGCCSLFAMLIDSSSGSALIRGQRGQGCTHTAILLRRPKPM